MTDEELGKIPMNAVLIDCVYNSLCRLIGRRIISEEKGDYEVEVVYLSGSCLKDKVYAWMLYTPEQYFDLPDLLLKHDYSIACLKFNELNSIIEYYNRIKYLSDFELEIIPMAKITNDKYYNIRIYNSFSNGKTKIGIRYAYIEKTNSNHPLAFRNFEEFVKHQPHIISSAESSCINIRSEIAELKAEVKMLKEELYRLT